MHVGGRLLAAVEGAARAATLSRLEVKASLNAVPFYEARGYVVVEAQRHGVAVRQYAQGNRRGFA